MLHVTQWRDGGSDKLCAHVVELMFMAIVHNDIQQVCGRINIHGYSEQ